MYILERFGVVERRGEETGFLLIFFFIFFIFIIFLFLFLLILFIDMF